MTSQKTMSIFLTICLIATLVVPSVSLAEVQEVMSCQDSSLNLTGETGDGSVEHTDGSGQGGCNGGGKGSGKGGGKGGGQGGGCSGDHGGSGNAGGGQPEVDGSIELTVTVAGIEQEVNVILTRDGEDQVVRTVNHMATIVSEPSGDCALKGEDVPGYVTPVKEISLTGNQKQVAETLEYTQATIPVTSVTLDKSNLQLIEGFSEQLTATIQPANASGQDVIWTSSNTEATVVNNGLVEAKKAGRATVTATTNDGDYQASCDVKVVSINSLEDKTISAIKNEIVGLPTTVVANLVDAALTSVGTASLPVKWQTEAGVEVGSTFNIPLQNPEPIYRLIGIVQGTALTAELTINVDQTAPAAIPVTGVELNENLRSLYVGETYQLTATVLPDQASNKQVEWSSSAPTVAKVDDDGTVTALSTGSATITVRTVDGNKQAYCMLSIALEPEISLIYPISFDGSTVDNFDVAQAVYIDVKNLVSTLQITEPTTYHVKVEQKGSNPLLGEGTVVIGPNSVKFNLFKHTRRASDGEIGFDLTDNYSHEYFVSISTDSSYPKDEDQTLKTNFKIGSATPTVPKESLDVKVSFAGGPKESDPQGVIFILARELDEKTPAETSWEDYCTNTNAPAEHLQFTDEVKVKGKTDANGAVVWEEPKETIKLGGYLLLEVTPRGYIDNLNLIDPNGDDGTLLKEIHISRDGAVSRDVYNVYVDGNDNGSQPADKEITVTVNYLYEDELTVLAAPTTFTTTEDLEIVAPDISGYVLKSFKDAKGQKRSGQPEDLKSQSLELSTLSTDDTNISVAFLYASAKTSGSHGHSHRDNSNTTEIPEVQNTDSDKLNALDAVINIQEIKAILKKQTPSNILRIFNQLWKLF